MMTWTFMAGTGGVPFGCWRWERRWERRCKRRGERRGEGRLVGRVRSLIKRRGAPQRDWYSLANTAFLGNLASCLHRGCRFYRPTAAKRRADKDGARRVATPEEERRAELQGGRLLPAATAGARGTATVHLGVRVQLLHIEGRRGALGQGSCWAKPGQLLRTEGGACSSKTCTSQFNTI